MAVILGITSLLNEAEDLGADIQCNDGFNVHVRFPQGFPISARKRLLEARPRGMVRLLMRARALSRWLTEDLVVYLHGESTYTPDDYGTRIDMFIDLDTLLRNVFDFEDCIFGQRGCPSESAVRCKACTTEGHYE
jgi:hypothetical protein